MRHEGTNVERRADSPRARAIPTTMQPSGEPDREPPTPPPPRRKKRRRPTPHSICYPSLEITQILTWMDSHRACTGAWPRTDSGPVFEAPREKWANPDACLRGGFRGLQPGSSLARLLAAHRGVRNPQALYPLTEKQILAWADAHQARTGDWPTVTSGAIPDSGGETWGGVNAALMQGRRGLAGGSSIRKLLARHRGVRHRLQLPRLTVEQILEWADAHYHRTGGYPRIATGPIVDAPYQTWRAVDDALDQGLRGLPGGSSLARLLQEHRGIRNPAALPPLQPRQILAWATVHRVQTGHWPSYDSGPVSCAPGETWNGIHLALLQGGRDLPGGISLSRFLCFARGVRHSWDRPMLPVGQILAWADAYRARTGAWPKYTSGALPEGPDITWMYIDRALRQGQSGLPGGSSLAKLLAQERGVRNQAALPPLSVEQILAWARAHQRGTGKWPTPGDGPVAGVPGVTWRRVDRALRLGLRSLPGGCSLFRLSHGDLGARRSGGSP